MDKQKIEKFNIIVMIDVNNGMSIKNYPPANIKEWSKFVYEKTTSVKNQNTNNSIIMGRKTYEMMFGTSNNCLEKRNNYVISSKMSQENYTSVIILPNLISCLITIGKKNKINESNTDTWIIGGHQLIKYALSELKTYCKQIIICKLRYVVPQCDLFFPMYLLQEGKNKKDIVTPININIKSSVFQIIVYDLNNKIQHQEKKYLNLLSKIYDKKKRLVRYGKSYYYSINECLNFNLKNEIPILTVRNILYQKIIQEIIEDFSNTYFNNDGLGFRLRCNGLKFEGPGEYTLNDKINLFLDQSVRCHNMFTIYLHTEENNEMFVPIYINFNISDTKEYLNCNINYNEIDILTHLPYHIIYFSILLNILSHLLSLKPNELNISITKCYIIDDLIDYSFDLSNIDPKPLAKCIVREDLNDMSDLSLSNIIIQNYISWPNNKKGEKYLKILYG